MFLLPAYDIHHLLSYPHIENNLHLPQSSKIFLFRLSSEVQLQHFQHGRQEMCAGQQKRLKTTSVLLTEVVRVKTSLEAKRKLQ
jgi:hypothetical protein